MVRYFPHVSMLLALKLDQLICECHCHLQEADKIKWWCSLCRGSIQGTLCSQMYLNCLRKEMNKAPSGTCNWQAAELLLIKSPKFFYFLNWLPSINTLINWSGDSISKISSSCLSYMLLIQRVPSLYSALIFIFQGK